MTHGDGGHIDNTGWSRLAPPASRDATTEGETMAPIIESIEIARSADDVFAYAADPSHLTEWQASLVSVRAEGEGGATPGSRFVTVRKVGGRERTMTMEVTEVSRPRSWSARGVDGPVRGIVRATVEPTEGGARSRLTIELEFEGHGIGKLLVPLVVRRQASAEMPENMRKLKDALERDTTQT
jgi:uncharacterized protein YndB with AHSA1/START domain